MESIESVINSEEMTVKLTPHKAKCLKEACMELLNTQHLSIREVASVVAWSFKTNNKHNSTAGALLILKD